MTELNKQDHELITSLIDKYLATRPDYSDGSYRRAIASAVSGVLGPKKYSIKDKACIAERIFARLKGYDILQPLMDDPHITDILVNGPEHIFFEKSGTLEEYSEHFENHEHLINLIHRIFESCGKSVTAKDPISDITLSDGSRANAVIPPVAVDGPLLSIRKFTTTGHDMSTLISCGFLSERQADYLSGSVTARRNIFISGGTGTGKTTFLNVLSEFIPASERIIVIEDSPELKLSGSPNLVRLQTRDPFADKSGKITISDLIRCALRMRPDRIIVGEVRGSEAADMLWAMNTGHKGSLSTGHSNSAEDMLNRLCVMVRSSSGHPAELVNIQIASAIDTVVHLERGENKLRHIAEIINISGYTKGEFEIEYCN
ncbi:MAG: ATPase, T2SS/T4P/T4SS family [Eubacteriales bacterium]|nr:ATPase, T2SS/T4P/T4SS family [Eubacteriales bacterium]MDD4326629.1 ATPase, T2SS/T4P/T4SS family [Eubacteriales bacterium]MDD4716559.1 ATPase, T2SS/T4P/T4SS family [Eubacteriales bacterium]